MRVFEILSALTLMAAGIVLFSGCDQSPETSPPKAEKKHVHAGHAPGPHDGTLADWGGGRFHVEFTVDHDKREATVYILGDDEKTRQPIATETIQLTIQDPSMQVTMTAAPQDGDAPGTTSRFVGNHEGLGVVQEYAGTITGVVDGTPYSGDFAEEAHGSHGHSHGGDSHSH